MGRKISSAELVEDDLSGYELGVRDAKWDLQYGDIDHYEYEEPDFGYDRDGLCLCCDEKKALVKCIQEFQYDANCSHRFCQECLTQWIDVQVKQLIRNIRCPDIGCKQMLYPSDVSRIAGKKIGQQYLELLHTDFSQRIKDLKSGCDKLFAEWVQAETQVCPVCSVIVNRSEGCNSMHCTCGAHFCYDCGKSKCSCWSEELEDYELPGQYEEEEEEYDSRNWVDLYDESKASARLKHVRTTRYRAEKSARWSAQTERRAKIQKQNREKKQPPVWKMASVEEEPEEDIRMLRVIKRKLPTQRQSRQVTAKRKFV